MPQSTDAQGCGSGGFPGDSETCWHQRRWISAEDSRAVDERAGGRRLVALRLSLLLA